MFTVKATYRNETRKFSFPDTSRFPSYDDLYHQLYRVFPISHAYYFSKLIFSPDASKPSRILIGREVHSADEYNACVTPMQHLSWPNALLRFTIYDETPHKAPSVTSGQQDHSEKPVAKPYFSGTAPSLTISNKTPSPKGPYHYISSAVSPSHVPPPPIIFSSPSHQGPHFPSPPLSLVPKFDTSTNIDSHSSPQNGSVSSNAKMQSQTSYCCPVSQGKAEIQTLLSSFKEDLDEIMSNTFGSPHATDAGHTKDDVETEMNVESNLSENEDRLMASPRPEEQSVTSPASEQSKWCFVCRTQFQGPWYGCIKCPWHSVCPACFDKSGPTHTSSFGPSHIVERHVSYRVSLPPADAPSTIRSEVNAGRDTQVADSSPSIHRGVLCDKCNEIIVGIRHKCLDCPDYDLCTPCMESGTAERHNPFHEFFDIEIPGRVFVHTIFSGGSRSDEGANNIASHPSLRGENRPDAGAGRTLHNATCNLCDSPIEGDRYKCLNCPDFDTCFACFGITTEQHPNHGFVKVQKPEYLMMRNALSFSSTKHYATCNSCKQRICGVRYKCMHPSCPDFDLCAGCEALPIPVHPAVHPLLKMKTVDTVIPTVYRFGQMSLIEQHGGEMMSSELPTRSSSRRHPSRSSSASFSTPRVDIRDSVKTPEPRVHIPLPAFTSPVISRTVDEISISKEEEEPLHTAFSSPIVHQSSLRSASSDEDHVHSILMPPQSTLAGESDVTSLLPESSRDVFHESWPRLSQEIKHLTRSQSPVTDSGRWWMHSPSKKDQDNLIELQPGTDFARPCDSDFVKDNAMPPLVEPETEMVQRDPTPVTSVHPFSDLLCGYRSPSGPNSPVASVNPVSVGVEEEETESKQKTPPQSPSKYPRLNSAFLADTTVPDGQIFPPGAEFVKSWRLLNNGDSAWPETTEIQFLAGESFAHDFEQIAKVGKVDPGEEIDVWTGELKAPDVPGRYVSYWRLSDGQGNLFGGSIWVDVTVVEHHNSDGASEHSLASSSIIMPGSAPDRDASASSAVIDYCGNYRRTVSVELASLATSKPVTTETLSDDGSSVSLISVPSSPDDDDLSVWQDTRSQVEVSALESGTAAEYVVLYDSSSSEED